jgi:hypothetical protein
MGLSTKRVTHLSLLCERQDLQLQHNTTGEQIGEQIGSEKLGAAVFGFHFCVLNYPLK